MSFKINWNSIEKQSLSSYATELLNEALNSGKRPNILSSDIKIVDLNFGNIAPDFEILEIGDLGPDRFRGIFKFKYDGDAYITVNTKVSASPLKIYNNNIFDDLSEMKNSDISSSEEVSNFISPKFNVSNCDFDIPLNLTLSKFKLSSIIIIVFSKTKGLTLVFKNDPLESIEVSSTFDRIKPIAKFLQKTIETQISELFKEFLPSLLYKFSLKYTTQSFDQFHKDLLNEEQDVEEKRILLKDLDPEQPLKISPGSLMRLTRLSSSRQTLSLGGKLSCDRMNDDLVTKTFANAILASTNTFNLNKIQLTNADFQFGSIGSKLSIIKEFQNRSFVKNSSFDDLKPKRRTIKMKTNKKKSKEVEIISDNNSESNSVGSTLVSNSQTTVPKLPSTPPLLASTPSTSSSSPTSRSESSVDTLIAEPLQSISLSTDTKVIDSNYKLPGNIVTIIDKKSNGLNNNRKGQLSFQQGVLYASSPRSSLSISNNNNNNEYHIDKIEQLKIKDRRMKLDKLFTNSPHSSSFSPPFMEAPPPYTL